MQWLSLGTKMCIRDRYIACNAPKAGEADFASVVEGLRKEAGRRAESVQRERQQNEEEKRRKRLEEIKDVLPFRMLCFR